MDFTLTHACGPPSMAQELSGAQVLLIPLVWVGMLLWLRRSPRDARDVLGAQAAAPASRWSRLRGFSGGLVRTAVLFVPFQAVLFQLYLWFAFGPKYCAFCPRDTPGEPSQLPFVVLTLVGAGALLVWLRKPALQVRDVLRVDARA